MEGSMGCRGSAGKQISVFLADTARALQALEEDAG